MQFHYTSPNADNSYINLLKGTRNSAFFIFSKKFLKSFQKVLTLNNTCDIILNIKKKGDDKMENKTKETHIKAVRKWEKENVYKVTITFYKKDFPKEKFEKAKEEIRKMGMSQNEFFVRKVKELIGE